MEEFLAIENFSFNEHSVAKKCFLKFSQLEW